jgi:hypothetical protein
MWSCAQLADEDQRVQAALTHVSDLQRSNANADAAMVVGAVFLWPVAFGLAATTDHHDEVSRLKGQIVALDEEQRVKVCGRMTGVPG